MLRNYIKIALRNLFKSRVYSTINVLGLSVGIASCLLIFIHIEDELSYDKSHEKKDRIHKIVLERLYPDHVTNYAITPHSFSDVLVNDFPEVENAVRLFGGGNNPVLVRYVDDSGNEKVFEESRFAAADSTFFDVFSFNLLKGEPSSALSAAQSMVITEAMAKKYFGDEDPLNKTLTTDFGEFKVTGVMENIPPNSHFEFDFLSSLRSLPFIFQNENFVSFTTHTYLLLAPNASPSDLEAKFPRMVESYAAPQIESNLNTTYAEYIAAGNGYNYSLIPLEEIYLHPIEYQGEFKAGGSINDIYIFISIAVLILIIACINFMNLSTARSTERAKEVGIRKTLGSPRSHLIGQFLTESVMITVLATIFAIGLVYLVLPYFNNIAGKQLALAFDSWSVFLILVFAIAVGLLAGSYPAFVLSGFNPVSVLKGRLMSNQKNRWLRNGLVVFQFAISIILIAGTLIVQQQLNFMKNKDLGFDEDRVMVIDRIGVLEDKQQTFLDEVRALPAVLDAGASSTLPVNQFFGIQFLPQGASEGITANAMTVDDNYAETMSFEMVEGRDFSEKFNDSLSIIINQQFAKLLDSENPVGMKLRHTTPGDTPVYRFYEIVGVVKDFHYMTLKDRISPFALLSNESAFNFNGFISIKVRESELSQAISSIEDKWKAFVPEEPFKYKFLGEELANQYEAEAKSGAIFGIFAGLAIFIACVGLFGLAAYMAGLRTKEIGIRKVMGASVFKVVLLLSKDFTKLILIALIIAVPVSWYFMDKWLQGFAYKVSVSFWVFLIAGGIALLIAWLTVSYQSIKAAIVNPVKSLRSE